MESVSGQRHHERGVEVSHWCTVRCRVNGFPLLLPEVEGTSLFHETHDAQGGHIVFLPQYRNRFRPLSQCDKPCAIALGKSGFLPNPLEVNRGHGRFSQSL